MQALDELNSKLNMLLKKYATTEAENTRLRAAIDKHIKTEDQLKKRIALMEKDMTGVNLGTIVGNDEEKAHMRTQLDNLIAEIDGILNTLND
jgi:hypothetical protein